MNKLLVSFSFSLMLAAVAAFAFDRVEAPKSCQQCGMDRIISAQSRMLIVYADGERIGTCSLRCGAAKLKRNADRAITSLQVADYKTMSLIDAQKATWVVGGKKHGFMTSLPKWAFARKTDAAEFVKKNGGKLAAFNQVRALAEQQ